MITPSISQIKRAASAHYDVPVIELESERRTKAVVMARHVAMTAAKRLTTRSLPFIGRHFGGKDHTSVLHAVRRIESLVKSDPVIADDLHAVMSAAVERPGAPEDAEPLLDGLARRLAAIVAAELRQALAPADVHADTGPPVQRLLAAVRRLEHERFGAKESRAIEDVIAAGKGCQLIGAAERESNHG